MSGNRFEFLEFGEEGQRAEPEAGHIDPKEPTHGGAPQALKDKDGRLLSQVRFGDLDPEEGLKQDAAAVETGTLGRHHAEMRHRFRVAEVFGSRGAQTGQFNSPTGLAVDRSGVLFIADSYNHRVQRITPSGGVAVIGSRGGGRNQFLSPQGVATDGHQAFYVVEQGNHRVQKYSTGGLLQLVFGRLGRGDGEMRSPTAIAIAPGSGDIYIADTGNSRVQRFDRDGNFLCLIGARGGLYPALVSPQALAVDARDNLYVADTFANRVLQYDPLSRPVGGFRPPNLYEPRALACDSQGQIYVADSTSASPSGLAAPGRLHVLDAQTGAPRCSPSVSTTAGPLQRPSGLAVTWMPDPVFSPDAVLGDVYVADTGNNRVLRLTWN